MLQAFVFEMMGNLQGNDANDTAPAKAHTRNTEQAQI
jgi:hypothetical protein